MIETERKFKQVGLRQPVKQKILLVEDHEDTIELMVLLLNQLNYDVATAATISGASGLADAADFDLFVLDSFTAGWHGH